MKKERSFSGGISETPGSPGSARKKNEVRSNLSSTKLRAPPPPSFLVSSDTVFYIPGLDVKVTFTLHLFALFFLFRVFMASIIFFHQLFLLQCFYTVFI